MGSQRRILVANLGYMKLALIPAVVMIVPVILIMIQLNLRYSQVGFAPGETAMVKVRVEEGFDVIRGGIRLTTNGAVEKASPAVRIPSLGETDWKIRLTGDGVHNLTLATNQGEMRIPVFATGRIVPIFRTFKKSSIMETVFNPGAPRIPDALPIESVEITYPEMSFGWGLFSLSWLWSFLVISMVFGVFLKLVLKVE